MTNRNYEFGDYNKRIYSSWRRKWEEFFRSERYYLEGEGAVPGVSDMSVLDVGGAAGGLGTALLDSVSKNIDYTCFDPDTEAINFGRENDSRLKFMQGYFPNDLKVDTKYDMVTLFASLSMFQDWKSTLFSLKKYAKKYINFTATVRLDGTTSEDIDTSYMYYLNSGDRVHQYIFNIYELLNFCSLSELEASELKFYGYRTIGNEPDSFRPLPDNKLIKGNLLIVIDEGRYSDGRTGGCSNPETLAASGVTRVNVRPKLEVNIEGHVYRSYNEIDTFKFD